MPRSTRALVTAALAVPLLSWSGGGAYAAPPTCDGLPATIVGVAGGAATGTDGDDVIVSNGAVDVRAGAGDDHVCLGDPVPLGALVGADAGDGDDRVLADLSAGSELSVTLGAGDDSFRGGAESDQVSELASAYRTPFTGRDVISTGAGDDRVSVGAEGFSVNGGPEPPRDVVDLGEGDDGLDVQDQVAAGFSAVAGTGRDGVTFVGHSSTWTMDNVLGLLRHGGESYRVRSFEGFGLFMPETAFRGGPGADGVRIGLAAGAVTMGTGDDSVILDSWTGAPLLAGGAGEDEVELHGPGQLVTLDLARGRWVDDTGRLPAVPLSGFEHHIAVAGRRMTLVGTRGDDDLAGYACLVRGHGRRGDDVLTTWNDADGVGCLPRARLFGGPGDDDLYGERRDDRLIGDRGHDRAYGFTGRDLCRAEVRRRCERR